MKPAPPEKTGAHKKFWARAAQKCCSDGVSVYWLSITSEDQPGWIVEQHAYTVVAQLITKAVFVRVVHPLRHPVDWHTGRLFCIFCVMDIHIYLPSSWAGAMRFPKLPFPMGPQGWAHFQPNDFIQYLHRCVPFQQVWRPLQCWAEQRDLTASSPAALDLPFREIRVLVY